MSTPPLDLDQATLADLSQLLAAATPGPWESGTATCCPDMGWVDGPAGKGKVCPQYQATKTTHTLDAYDAELIAAMRNALPALLADHARLTAEVDRLREGLEVQHMAEADTVRAIVAWLRAECADSGGDASFWGRLWATDIAAGAWRGKAWGGAP